MTKGLSILKRVGGPARRTILRAEPFGIHLMIDGFFADPALTVAEIHFQSVLTMLPERLGVNRICDPVVVRVGSNNKKNPDGPSGPEMIAASLIKFHSFLARGFISIDVYTCIQDTDLWTVTAHTVEAFAIRDLELKIETSGERSEALTMGVAG